MLLKVWTLMSRKLPEIHRLGTSDPAGATSAILREQSPVSDLVTAISVSTSQPFLLLLFTIYISEPIVYNTLQFSLVLYLTFWVSMLHPASLTESVALCLNRDKSVCIHHFNNHPVGELFCKFLAMLRTPKTNC